VKSVLHEWFLLVFRKIRGKDDQEKLCDGQVRLLALWHSNLLSLHTSLQFLSSELSLAFVRLPKVIWMSGKSFSLLLLPWLFLPSFQLKLTGGDASLRGNRLFPVEWSLLGYCYVCSMTFTYAIRKESCNELIMQSSSLPPITHSWTFPSLSFIDTSEEAQGERRTKECVKQEEGKPYNENERQRIFQFSQKKAEGNEGQVPRFFTRVAFPFTTKHTIRWWS